MTTSTIDELPVEAAFSCRFDERRHAILEAALELIVEVGYERMSMDALAERAHASKATIYRHWDGKAAIVAEAVQKRQCESLGNVDTGTLRGDLLSFLEEARRSMAQGDGALIAGVFQAMRTDDALATLMREQVLEGKRISCDAIVSRAVERGELAPTANGELIHEILPSMLFMRILVNNEPVDKAFCDHLVDDILLPLLQR
jgi:AcrR family transcriptional regulator